MRPFPFDPSRPNRRQVTSLGLVLALTPLVPRPQGGSGERAVERAADGEPRLVAPPGEPVAAQAARIAALAAALSEGRQTVESVLADPASNELRPYPAFRSLIAAHAPAGRTVLVPSDEPGTRMRATVRVTDPEGQALEGVRVYAYQTSARGWYAAEAPHVSGNSGDTRFARLFTYGKTRADGTLELETVHPAGYPRSDLPSHIHLHLEHAGATRVTEIRFEDCPRMTPAVRAQSLREGYVVVPVVTVDGEARCTAEFVLR